MIDKKVGFKKELKNIVNKYTNIKGKAFWISDNLKESPSGRKYLIIKVYV